MKVLIVAGGTGGHIFPALSIAEELYRQGAEVHWMGSYVGLEKKIVEPHYPLHLISVKPIRGKNILNKIMGLLGLSLSIGKAWWIIHKLKPDLVLCVGGFVSGPGGMAARLSHIPLIIHESNAIAGYTNRILSRFAKHTLCGFPNAFSKKIKTTFVGNPVRPAISAIPVPEFRYRERNKNFKILVLGGSRGAHAINQMIPKILPLLAQHETLEIWHQTGMDDYDELYQTYQSYSSINIKISRFIDDMVGAYSWADLVICRSGAMTVTELAAVGLPAILIPFPYAVDDHQFYNAEYLANAGAAVVIRQKDLFAKELTELLESLRSDRTKLMEMAKSARKCSHPNAIADIVAACFEIDKDNEEEKHLAILHDKNIKRIHCIGIGGIGLSGIAEILHQKGYTISGSDISTNRMTEHLKKLGIKIMIGHQATHVLDADAIVYSSAINKNNVEFAAAIANNIPLIQRGRILAEMMQTSIGIAVAGTHGKTTTTGLIADCFLQNNIDATFVMGGILNNQESTAHVGTSKYFIAESDESDASFLYMKPTYAIITNIDADHLVTYSGSFAKLKKSFVEFLNDLPKDGLAILCIDDPIIKSIIPSLNCKFITYGFSENANYQATDFKQLGLQTQANVKFPDNKTTLPLILNLPGKHNLLNALSAVVMSSLAGISSEGIINALKQFPGVNRRFHSHGEIHVNGGKALLFDDYGHHPNEIKATIEAARQAWPNRRIVMVFQPHRYSRTKELIHEFANVLKHPDLLLLLDIYSAGESDTFGVDSRELQRLITEKGSHKPLYVPKMDELPTTLKKILKAEDVVIFQGAGSIGPYANKVAELFISQ